MAGDWSCAIAGRDTHNSAMPAKSPIASSSQFQRPNPFFECLLNMVNPQGPCASIDARIRNWDVFARSQIVPLSVQLVAVGLDLKLIGPVGGFFRGFT